MRFFNPVNHYKKQKWLVSTKTKLMKEKRMQLFISRTTDFSQNIKSFFRLGWFLKYWKYSVFLFLPLITSENFILLKITFFFVKACFHLCVLRFTFFVWCTTDCFIMPAPSSVFTFLKIVNSRLFITIRMTKVLTLLNTTTTSCSKNQKLTVAFCFIKIRTEDCLIRSYSNTN